MSGLASAEFVAAFEAQNAALRAEMRDLLAKSDEILCEPVSAAWREIESLADRLVEKAADGLTKEKAVARVLGTPRGKQLYTNYLAAQDSVRQTLELAEGSAARRSHDQWVRERTVDAVAKADVFGAGLAEERARELVRDPAIAKAFGGRARQPVEKGSAAWEEIERRAASLIQKSEGLSQAQAVERVLREHPDLYGRYMADVEAGWEAVAKSEGLNSGQGVAGPSRFGSADGEPLSPRGTKTRTPRQVLVELAERLERAENDGEDTDDVLTHELRDPGVRKVVMAAVDALPENTEKAASKRELRRRLEGLEAGGRKSRRRPRQDPTTGAVIAKSEHELWDTIVEKSGASPRDPNFSRTVDGFLSTREGQQLYAQYERAYEARDATLTSLGR